MFPTLCSCPYALHRSLASACPIFGSGALMLAATYARTADFTLGEYKSFGQLIWTEPTSHSNYKLFIKCPHVWVKQTTTKRSNWTTTCQLTSCWHLRSNLPKVPPSEVHGVENWPPRQVPGNARGKYVSWNDYYTQAGSVNVSRQQHNMMFPNKARSQTARSVTRPHKQKDSESFKITDSG